VALYRAVYGAMPFAGEDVEALAESVVAGALRPPPARPEVPPWLSPLVRRGLSTDPARRFPSMTALLAALEARLPRAPDLDPSAVRRERRLLLGMLGALILAIPAFVAILGPARTFESPRGLVELAFGAVVVVAAALVALRRKLLKNRYGRRLAAIFMAPCLVWLLHRLVALRLGTPPLHVIVVDLILFGAVFGTAAVTFERWMGWVAVLAFAGAAASAFAPALGPPMLSVVSAVGLLAVPRWYR
jgi:hypothetical protein